MFCTIFVTKITNFVKTMKRTQLFSLILFISALLAAGCCDCRKRSQLVKPLVGTEWQLVQLMAKDIVADGDSYRLTFKSDGNIVGKGDCNILSATYQTTPSRSLEIKELGSTRRLCKNYELENAFMDMLEGVTHYEMDADHMLFLSNGTLVAIFKAVTE